NRRQVGKQELLRFDNADARELRAIQHNLDQLRRESIELRRQLAELAPVQAELRRGRNSAEAVRDRLQRELTSALAELDYMRGSFSWRTTAPLRSVRALWRRRAES